MQELRAEVEILAPAEGVWQLLTDFAGFQKWNPFIRHINGEAYEGAWLEVHVQPAGRGSIKSRPTVLRVNPCYELCWFEYRLMPGLFDREYRFIIEPLDNDRVRFVQRGIFTGLLVPLLAWRVVKGMRRGFEEMSQALKVQAERVRQISY